MTVEIYRPNENAEINGITISAAAQLRLSDQLKKHGKGIGIRLTIKPTGCSGFSYQLDFVDEVATDDQKFSAGNISIFIKKEMLKYVEGTELDYVKEGLNEKFVYRNPKAKGVCGCGESFTVT